MNLFELSFMRTALAASLLAGNAVALLGLFVLMRRVAFAGLSIAQLAALGAVVGILIGHGGSLGVAVALVFAGLVLLSRFERASRLPREAMVACLYVLGAGFSVLILSKAPWGEAHTMNVFFGNVLTLGAKEVWEGIALVAMTAAVLGAWFHRWVWLSFDRLSAEVSGISLGAWDAVFYALFAAGMTLGIHLFGVLLAFSYLLMPAVASLALTNKLKPLIISVFCITTGATLAGFILSFHFDLPTGPFVSTLLAVCALAAVVARRAWRPYA